MMLLRLRRRLRVEVKFGKNVGVGKMMRGGCHEGEMRLGVTLGGEMSKR